MRQGIVWRVAERIRRWFADRRRRRAAERLLDELFASPQRLAMTSLRPDHRSRCQLLDLSGAPARIGFGIARHPRPYAFSRQFHEVVELWLLDTERGTLERVRGVNLTRVRGSDGETNAF